MLHETHLLFMHLCTDLCSVLNVQTVQTVKARKQEKKKSHFLYRLTTRTSTAAVIFCNKRFCLLQNPTCLFESVAPCYLLSSQLVDQPITGAT